MTEFVHIVAFDIPYPPNYGGAIDVFFRIKSLSEAGLRVILHCYEYSRAKSDVLEQYCSKVFYYKRNTSIFSHVSVLPYTVISRKNKELLKNLMQDDYPIIFEGLMSCYYIDNEHINSRIKVYREANIEHQYYYELFKSTPFSINKFYYIIESLKFKLFERKIRFSQIVLAISEIDARYFTKKFKDVRVEFIPCFHSNKEINRSLEVENYILYHGNLSVAENEKAAIYLSQNVFSKLNCRCVIAGMNPSERLLKKCAAFENVKVVPNPTEVELNSLLSKAKINLLVTFQSTGLKIKLLNALFAGKYIITNDKMLAGSGLESLCYIANCANDQIELCKRLIESDFSNEYLELRRNFLIPNFLNENLAARIKQIINK